MAVALIIVAVFWFAVVVALVAQRRWLAMSMAAAAPVFSLIAHWLAIAFPVLQIDGWAPTMLADLVGAGMGLLVLIGAAAVAVLGLSRQPGQDAAAAETSPAAPTEEARR